MRFERLRGRGVGPFTEEIDLDLSAIEGRIVAIVGPNGAGKSTLLELWPGAMYRQCPTRGSLIDLATMRGAFVEATVSGDARYLIRQNMDPIGRKGEVLVLDENGNRLVESAKVREFDAWAAAHLPSSTELYSSSFAVQGRRGVLDLLPGERKALLVRLLGLEKLEQLAEVARDRTRRDKDKLTEIAGKLSMIPHVNVDELNAKRDGLKADLERAIAEVAQAESRVSLAMQASKDYERFAEIAERAKTLTAKKERITASLAKIDREIATAKNHLKQEPAVREAVALVATLRPEWEAIDAMYRGFESELYELKNAQRQATDAHAHAVERLRETTGRIGRMESLLASVNIDGDEVAQIAEQAQVDIATYVKEIGRVQSDIADLADSEINGKEYRIKALRDGLTEITSYRHPDDDAPTIARGTLDEDDAAAERLASLPTRKFERVTELADLTRWLEEKRAQLRDAEGMIAKLEALEGTRQELTEMRVVAERLQIDIDTAKATLEEVAKPLNAKIAEQQTAKTKAAELYKQLQAAEGEAGKLAGMERMRATLEGLESEQARVAADGCELNGELAALPELPEDSEPPDLAGYKAEVTAAKKRENDVRATIVEINLALEEADRLGKVWASLESEREAVQRTLSGWNHLATAFGRDGLQAMEMNAALPEINTIANDLLHTCHGSRFTVEVSTDRLSADGKKTVETLEIRVIDTTNGRDAAVETFSGGECVIVGEALSLALTTVACRHNNIQRPTLIRDESGAALDPVNGRAYMAMLRRAADLIDADKVLVVSHSAEIQDLADAKVLVSDGGVSYL